MRVRIMALSRSAMRLLWRSLAMRLRRIIHSSLSYPLLNKRYLLLGQRRPTFRHQHGFAVQIPYKQALRRLPFYEGRPVCSSLQERCVACDVEHSGMISRTMAWQAFRHENGANLMKITHLASVRCRMWFFLWRSGNA